MNRVMRTAMFLRVTVLMAFALALAACGESSTTSNGPSGTTSAGITSVGAPSTTPADSDPLAFSAASYSVAQNAGSVTLTVTRMGSPTSAVSVAYASSDSTAVAGADYTATSGTLQWAENDSTSKTISIPVSNATPVLRVQNHLPSTLSNPSVAAATGTPDVATVTISGDSTMAMGSLELSGASYAVAQNAGNLTVTVNRTGGASGAVSVAYATANGTASAGTDYTATTGTLNWSDADATSKTFTVAISNAVPFSGNKTFTVTLSNPGGGAIAPGTPERRQRDDCGWHVAAGRQL